MNGRCPTCGAWHDKSEVKIGKQVWTAQNLAVKVPGSWAYNDDEKNVPIYGRLYTWDAAIKAAPEGWHLPTDKEWSVLVDYYGGYKVAGERFKNGPFNALLSGYRSFDGSFNAMGSSAYFWSSSQYDATYAWFRYVFGGYTEVYRYSLNKTNGFCVRCVKD